MHNLKLVRSITSPESSLPLITIRYADQVIGAVKVDLREYMGGTSQG